jgi:hypothetical protein
MMILTLPHVVVPYAKFLERRERRSRVASELRRRDAQRTIDAETVAVPVAKPPSSEQKYRYERPVGNTEQGTQITSISLEHLPRRDLLTRS